MSNTSASLCFCHYLLLLLLCIRFPLLPSISLLAVFNIKSCNSLKQIIVKYTIYEKQIWYRCEFKEQLGKLTTTEIRKQHMTECARPVCAPTVPAPAPSGAASPTSTVSICVYEFIYWSVTMLNTHVITNSFPTYFIGLFFRRVEIQIIHK